VDVAIDVAVDVVVDVAVNVVVVVYAFCFMARPRINYVPKC